MNGSNLVIGGNGHLGAKLVRLLLESGEKVSTSVRDVDNEEPFRDLDCEIVYADLLGRDSLQKAMKGIDIVYVVDAAYKSWAPDVQEEIIDVNIKGTKNVAEAAVAEGVKKIVYVSSTFTLDHNNVPMHETGWHGNYSDPYS
jgi:dihydroflavonol-4-reductase